MSHRKDQKEELRRQREQREAAERAGKQRKRLVGIGAGVAMALAAVIVLVLAASGGGGDGGGIFPEGGSAPEQKEFDLEKAAAAAGCELTKAKGDGAGTHTTDLSERVKYRDNPPTSGRHFQSPVQDGVYGEKGKTPRDEELVHNLEHGRVVIWVKSTLEERWRAGLRALVDSEDFQTVLVPRAKMPFLVAATAWNRDPLPGGTGRTLGCDEFNPRVYDALQAFRDEHRSNGPEPVD